MSSIIFSSAIGPVPVDVIVTEGHQSTIGLTENPIETGSKVTDHAYVEAKRLTLEFGAKDATATYNAMVRFQESRVPFVFVSGLYVYKNMVIRDLSATRDSQFSKVLNGRCELQEVIIVSTSYTAAEGTEGDAKSNGKAGGTKSTRAARPTKERAGSAATADRASGTVTRADSPATTVPAGDSDTPGTNKSIAARMFQ